MLCLQSPDAPALLSCPLPRKWQAEDTWVLGGSDRLPLEQVEVLCFLCSQSRRAGWASFVSLFLRKAQGGLPEKI